MTDVALAVRKELESARVARRIVCLKREAIDAIRVDGFPIAIGPELVLLAAVGDWQLDGYAIVRLVDITLVRSEEYERFTERVLEGEGELARVAPPTPPVPVDSWLTVFGALRASGRYVLVHEEEYEDEPMSIGPVVGVRAESVLVHYVDATGEWEEEPSEIPFADITRVQVEDRYSSVFGRYAEKSRPAV